MRTIPLCDQCHSSCLVVLLKTVVCRDEFDKKLQVKEHIITIIYFFILETLKSLVYLIWLI